MKKLEFPKRLWVFLDLYFSKLDVLEYNIVQQKLKLPFSTEMFDF